MGIAQRKIDRIRPMEADASSDAKLAVDLT